MTLKNSRREWLRTATLLTVAGTAGIRRASAQGDQNNRWDEAIEKGLKWLSRNQSSRGQWNTQVYPTALAALAGTATGCGGGSGENYGGDPEFFVGGEPIEETCEGISYDLENWTQDEYVEEFGPNVGDDTADKWYRDMLATYEKYC